MTDYDERQVISMSFAEQTVIITGASGGIGSAMAREFSSLGAKLILVDIAGDRLAELAGELRELGADVRAHTLDVRDRQSLLDLVGGVDREFGRVDVLLNNAGTSAFGSLLEVTPETWDREIAVHMSGPFWLTQAVAPIMIRAGYGRIVNISSVAGLIGPLDLAPYGAAKAGLLGITRAASLELADHGITVNAIAAGPISTDLLRSTWPPAELQARAEHLPVRRLGEVGDIVNAAVFLSRPESGFVTGTVLPVDGGSVAAGAYMVEKYRRRHPQRPEER